MRRWLLILGIIGGLVSISISPADAGHIVRWTTLSLSGEYAPLTSDMNILQHVWVPTGETWTLNSGALLYPASTVCHLWENDASGAPLHAGFVAWGQPGYINLAPVTISGPTMFYFWCWNTGGPGQIFYSLEWTVTPY